MKSMNSFQKTGNFWRGSQLLIVLLATLVLTACGGGGGGGGTGGGGGGGGTGPVTGDSGEGGSLIITGSALYGNTADNSGITVNLLNSGSTSLTSFTTNSTGAYTITGLLDTNSYSVVASSDNSMEKATFLNFTPTAGDTAITMADMNLTATGSITGVAKLWAVAMPAVAFIPNTSITGFSDDNGVFTLNNVPVGSGITVGVSAFESGVNAESTGITVATGVATDLGNVDLSLVNIFSWGSVTATNFNETWDNLLPFGSVFNSMYVTTASTLAIEVDQSLNQGEAFRSYLFGSPKTIDTATPNITQKEVWKMTADVKVNDMYTMDWETTPIVGIEGGFFNDGSASGDSLVAGLYYRPSESGLTLDVVALVYQCNTQDDWACERGNMQWEESIMTNGATTLQSDVAMGTTATFTIDCDLNPANSATTYGQCVFTSTIGGTPGSVTKDIETDIAPGMGWSSIAANTTQKRDLVIAKMPNWGGGGGGGGGGGVGGEVWVRAGAKAEFDNALFLDGAGATVLSDAFPSGTLLDYANWEYPTRATSITNGALAMTTRSIYNWSCASNWNCRYDEPDFLNLAGMNNTATTYLQVDVSPGAQNFGGLPYSAGATTPAWNPAGWDGQPVHGLFNALYNDGTGTAGQAGDVYAAVFMQPATTANNWDTVYAVWRCIDNNCTGASRVDIQPETVLAGAGVAANAWLRYTLHWDRVANTVKISATPMPTGPDGTPGTPVVVTPIDLSGAPTPVGPALMPIAGTVSALKDPNWATLTLGAHHQRQVSFDNLMAY